MNKPKMMDHGLEGDTLEFKIKLLKTQLKTMADMFGFDATDEILKMSKPELEKSIKRAIAEMKNAEEMENRFFTVFQSLGVTDGIPEVGMTTVKKEDVIFAFVTVSLVTQNKEIIECENPGKIIPQLVRHGTKLYKAP